MPTIEEMDEFNEARGILPVGKLAKALAASSSAGWQPIDTAPKDTAILLYGFGFSVAHFNTAYGKWIAYGYETPDTIMLNTASSAPTHWMPLPAAPV